MSSGLFEIPVDVVSWTAEDALAAFASDEFAFELHRMALNDQSPVIGVSLDSDGTIRGRGVFRLAAARALGRRKLLVSLDANSDESAFRSLDFVVPVVADEPKSEIAVARWHSFRFVEEATEKVADTAAGVIVRWFEDYWQAFERDSGSLPFDDGCLIARRDGQVDATLDLKLWTPWGHYDANWVRSYASLIRRVHEDVQPLLWSEAGLMRQQY